MSKSNNNKLTPDQQRVKNQALILEQEILGTFLNILSNADDHANVMKRIQQDFIGYFETGDYNYLRDGNIILTEIQSVFNSLSLASPEALEIIRQNNKHRIDKVSHLLHV